MTTPVLQIENVEKSFHRSGQPPVRAVHGVNLTVEPGETVALVGESGSGKSTLGRIALGLIRPDRGRVLLSGKCISDLPPRSLRNVRVAMQPIFQDPSASFNPRRTVRFILGQALRLHPPAEHVPRAITLLEGVGLRPAAALLDRLPHELSGGQRQRLAIARALAMDPMLIIADEPLSGADVSIRGQVLNLLGDLQRSRRVAYLMITHDISIARVFAHRVAVMFRGEIVESGLADQVLSSPSHAYTRKLVASVPVL